mmetsp:Transcript_15461/g.28024  ORF Transcript_15461/g.28024 Transcript_15461/m.28024 type:complete len:364 (+) Transcript_15461:342-1433(+)
MAVVLDSGALIQATNLKTIGAEYFTVQQVLAEVRDKRARDLLRDMHDAIQVREPTEEDMIYAVEFSKKTGDYTSLSRTDLLVVALAVRLEKERNGGIVLRAEPPPIIERQNKVTAVVEGAHKVLQDSEPTEETKQEQALEPAEGVEEEEAADESEEEVKSDEEGWITPHNYKQTAKTAAEWTDPTTRVMTSDFPVQNVVLQMGLKLVAIDGRTVKHIKRWVLKCQACKVITHDTTREFCQSCGNHTLVKISCYVDSAGTVKYSGGPRRPMLRGSKYPIPTHKGGKAAKNIILREDELTMMGGRQYSWLNKKKNDPLDYDAAEWAGLSLKQFNAAHYGPNKRNPNEAKKTVGVIAIYSTLFMHL